ncbi:serine/threonine protein phosphatase [Colletotrichum kahawae]|uniref:Serine/threonine protein phosphatase n=1 Tax=Colletotrichum kahawae TaxID=34407 RepID=A0AAD9YCL9_COLKA|nr:serine/threonine protein phosphatase [Colletotrichum kahawae]
MEDTDSKESHSLLESATPQLTVAELARACLGSFQKCLNKAAELHPRESTLVENQIARFSVWTASIGVFAPSRASLDHRLREALDVQDAVGGILEAIELRAQSCLHTLDSLGRPMSEAPLEAVDPKFNDALEGISQDISLLHRLSNTIRRASKDIHKQKAANSFHFKDEDGNDVERFLEKTFLYQVRDRFPGVSETIRLRLARAMLLRWKRILYRRSRYKTQPTRTLAQPGQPLVSMPRVQIKAKNNLNEANEETQGLQTKGRKENATKSVVRSMAITATTLAPDHFKKASAPSVVSMSKTVALSKHDDLRFPPAPHGVIKRRFKQFKMQRDADLTRVIKDIETKASKAEEVLQDVGKRIGKSVTRSIADAKAAHKETLRNDWESFFKAAGEVSCPFCLCMLPVSEVADDKKWREHVKGDLDPYICLFEACDSGDELYTHSHAWLKHMREHTLSWKCKSKSHKLFTALSRDEYLAHMREVHSGKFSDAQLGVLADRNARIAGSLFESCPLCGATDFNGLMEDHIVGHMRLLALKSLPPSYEEVEGSDDDLESRDSSSSSSASRSRSTLKNLNFSDEEHETGSDGLTSWNQRTRSQSTSDEESKRRPVPDPLPDPSSKSQRLDDPDCAICHSPVALACDCESKALDAAINQLYPEVMRPKYERIRKWVRAKSVQVVFRQYTQHAAVQQELLGNRPPPGLFDEKHSFYQRFGRSAVEQEEGHTKTHTLDPQEEDNTRQELQEESRQEVSGPSTTAPISETKEHFENNALWQGCVQGFPPILEYYFAQVQMSVPPDDDPAVRDPPISLIAKRRWKGGKVHIVDADGKAGPSETLEESE